MAIWVELGKYRPVRKRGIAEVRHLELRILDSLEKTFERIFGDMSLSQFHDLLFPGNQSPLVQRRRALLIISRVRMVAAVFALLTPLWIPVDLYVFDAPLGSYVSVLRTLATLAFAILALSFRNTESMGSAHRSLSFLLAIPTAFFLVSQPVLAEFKIVGQAQLVIAAGYAFLPFVMVAGLSVFPITAVEGVMLSVPLLVANLVVAFLGYQVLSFASHLGALWLLTLLAVVATLAGMSQLHFMMQLVSQASHDGLTKAYTRRVGEEMLDLQFAQAQRNHLPFTLAFIDLDNFKSINDKFGHEEGDNTLRQAAAALRRILRRADILIRWGGEEFLIVMPATDPAGGRIAVQRLREAGFGMRPDGIPQTASIGVSERITDNCTDWPSLVEKADHRMYTAKQAGKDRVVLCGDEELV
jgi:diguanylate cyclase (GGDEF)-like protein